MRPGLLAAALVAGLATTAAAEDVYYCADANVAGIKWGKNESEGDGHVTGFKSKRYVMKIISGTERVVTPMVGDTKGAPDHLTCRVPYPFAPMLLTCSDGPGMEAWAFNGSHYTTAYINGSPLQYGFTDPNILVAHGTCTRF